MYSIDKTTTSPSHPDGVEDTDSARSRSSRSQDDGCSESSMTVVVVYVPGRKKRGAAEHGHRGVRP